MKWRKAGSASMSTILWVLAAGAMALALGGGYYYMVHQGAQKSTASANTLSQKLWGNSAPQYDVSSVDGVGTLSIAPPTLAGVSWNTTTWPPTLSIQGTNLGNQPTSEAQPSLSITDSTRGWATTNVASSGVLTQVGSWTEPEIDVTGFANYGGADSSNFSDGQGSWVFASGDSIVVQVTNPQTGQQTSYPSSFPSMTMPSVSVNPLPASIIAGSAQTVTGTVTFNGQPLANQAINLSAAGSFTGSNGKQVTPIDFMVFTDNQGNWSANYTAPSTAGLDTITVMSDAVTAKQTVQVIPHFVTTLVATGDQTDNNVTLTATVNQPLNGFTLSILNETTGQTIASTTNGTSLTTQINAFQNETDTYIAQVN